MSTGEEAGVRVVKFSQGGIVRRVAVLDDDVDEHGRHRYTVAQIATEFGVTRPTIYRYLDAPTTA